MLQSFAGGRLVAERHGSGEPEVVALHGWGRSCSDYAPTLALLAEPALAVDLPGFGLSAPPPSPWTPGDYAGFLGEELLATLRAPVVVVGHSFGGRVAVHLAATYPGAVRALVLTGVPLFRGQSGLARPAVAYRVVRALARAGLVGERRLEAARRRYGSADYRNAGGVMRDVLVASLAASDDDAVARVTCPVALVWGARDTAAPLSVAEQAQVAFHGASLEVLDDDHFVPLHHPEALAKAIATVGGER